MRQLLPILRRCYPKLAKELLGPMLELMSIGRASCGGDLDKLLILLVVGMRTAEHKQVESLDYEAVLSGALECYPSLSTNVRSIADSTGIPKESVRRKVAALVEAGLIRRHGNALTLAPQASRVLTDWREKMFQMALRYHQLVAEVEAQDG